MNCDIIEIRLSLNGVTEGFLFTLFRLLDNEPNQILIKRINDPRFSLTSDDLILKGVFSQQFIKIISNFYPFIQSFKISSELITESIIEPYAAKTWIAKDIKLLDWACIGKGATIGAGATLQRTVVWDGALVPAGSTIKDAIVTP